MPGSKPFVAHATPACAGRCGASAAQGFGEGVRRHDDQHQVASGEGRGHVVRGAQRCRQLHARQVAGVLVRCVASPRSRRRRGPRARCRARGARSARRARCPRSPRRGRRPTIECQMDRVAMGGQALPTVSVPPRSVPEPICAARWRRFSAYRPSKLIGCMKNGGKPPDWIRWLTLAAAYGIQQVRALRAEHRVDAGVFEARQREHAGLLHFGQVGGLAGDVAGQRDAEDHFERGLAQALHLLVEVHLQLGRAGFVEHAGRAGRFERNVLDVDLLDREGRSAGGGGGAVDGSLRTSLLTPGIAAEERGRLWHAARRSSGRPRPVECGAQRPFTSGRSACCQAAMPPSSQYTCSKPACLQALGRACRRPGRCGTRHHRQRLGVGQHLVVRVELAGHARSCCRGCGPSRNR